MQQHCKKLSNLYRRMTAKLLNCFLFGRIGQTTELVRYTMTGQHR